MSAFICIKFPTSKRDKKSPLLSQKIVQHVHDSVFQLRCRLESSNSQVRSGRMIHNREKRWCLWMISISPQNVQYLAVGCNADDRVHAIYNARNSLEQPTTYFEPYLEVFPRRRLWLVRWQVVDVDAMKYLGSVNHNFIKNNSALIFQGLWYSLEVNLGHYQNIQAPWVIRSLARSLGLTVVQDRVVSHKIG